MSLLEVTKLRLSTIEDQRIIPFIDSIIVDEFIREVEDPLKRVATAEKLAQSFIDAISTIKLGTCKVALKLDLQRDGNPLGKWLEKGTRGHQIPKDTNLDAKPLHFYWGKIGKFMTLRSVWHPGFDGYHILEMVGFVFLPRFEKKIAKRTNEYLERTSLK